MSNIECWLESSLKRVYPGTQSSAAKSINLPAARGERVSLQACVRNLKTSQATVELSVEAPDGIDVTVRRVGCVAVPHLNTNASDAEYEGAEHIPGFVPDPLFPENTALVGPMESQSFWVDAKIPEGLEPGPYQLRLRFSAEEEELPEMVATVDVGSLTIEPLKNFPVTHWFYADALCDWYGLKPYDEAIWPIVERYMRDLVEHGGTCQYVPLFTPPTDGIKRPHQLLRVKPLRGGKYEFDFSDARLWVKLAKGVGAQYFEWTHLFSQWGVKNAIRVYRDNSDPESLLWPPETGATSPTYRAFLSQFLPEFKQFLDAEGLMDRSFFHLSDEPHDDHIGNYRAAREMLRELAPWLKVSDALSHIDFGRLGLTDIPIPSITTAKQYMQEGFPAWAYYCCGPRGRYINRLMDTPLPKIRISGWLFYHLKARGFLHWGYNYWYKSQTQQLIDPFIEQSGAAWPGWAYGDTFVVYPGPDGPIDSIRWEVWAQSLQDYALLQSAGIDPDDPMLSGLVDYNDFPRDVDWVDRKRRSLIR